VADSHTRTHALWSSAETAGRIGAIVTSLPGADSAARPRGERASTDAPSVADTRTMRDTAPLQIGGRTWPRDNALAPFNPRTDHWPRAERQPQAVLPDNGSTGGVDVTLVGFNCAVGKHCWFGRD
jgi:hypothetical protein